MILRLPRPQPGKFVFSDPKRVLQYYRRKAVQTQTASSDERDPIVMSPLGPPFMKQP
jgi:hypothetical protein